MADCGCGARILEPKLLRGSKGKRIRILVYRSRAVVFPASHDLIRIVVPDGAPEVIAKIDAFTRGGSWSDHDDILISSGYKLYTVRLHGMKPGWWTSRE